MRESSTYQLIVDEGRAKGLAEGWAEGRAEGRVEGLTEGVAKARAEDILRIGTKCLGKPARKVRETILSIREEARLDELLDRVLDVESWNQLVSK